MSDLTLDPRFNGPPHSANGGYACGAVAALADGPVTVSLRVPPPLGTAMQSTVDDGTVRVLHDGTLVAEGVPAPTEPATPPRVVDLAEAERAAQRYVGFDDHWFPTCWVCGPEREDGLRIFPGEVDEPVDRLVAAPWTPAPNVDAGDGTVRPEQVWAALDCTSCFGSLRDETGVLARMNADLAAPVHVGQTYVVHGWTTAAPDGRKRHAAAAVVDLDGNVVASARALWVTLSEEALASVLAPS